MNVSRHIAKDMRSALALVRDLHGPDAVILSNKKVPEGIEIMAAIDYDESQFAEQEKQPEKYSFPTLEEADALKQADRVANRERSQADKPSMRSGRRIETRDEELARQAKEQAAAHSQTFAEPIQRQTQDEEADWFDAEVEDQSTAVQQASEERPAVRQPQAPQNTTQSMRSASAQKDAEADFTDSNDENFDFTVALSEAARSNAASVDQSQQFKDILDALPEPEPTQSTAPVQENSAIWTNDSMLQDMRNELLSLKSLVETQISGFAWGDMSRRNPVRAGVLRKLVALGLTPSVARHIAYRMTEDLGHRKAWYRALAMFARQVPVAGDTILTHGGVVALVGPAGVGKTTLIAKLAVQYAARHGRENVALITTDSNRFGAFDQLRNLGSVLKIPVQAVDTAEQLDAALDTFIERPLVLIDTAGLSHRDERLFTTLQTLRRSSAMLKAHLVLSATTQADALEQTINAYKPVDPCGCIISKLDESTSMGPVLSAVVEHKLPISYTSEGQKIPDDLKIARIQDLVGKAVAISKSMNAFEKTEDFMMEQILMGESL